MASKKWTWRPSEYPKLVKIIESDKLDWYKIEAAGGYQSGITLLACSVLSIVREAIAEKSISSIKSIKDNDLKALALVDLWIDKPSDNHFDKICETLFATVDNDVALVELSPVVWWALRCSASHPEGGGETHWALEAFLEEMTVLGFTHDWLAAACRKGILSRKV
jgi:hypothetical protein